MKQKKTFKSTLYSILQISALASILAFGMLITPFAHSTYLLSKVGKNTVFIRSPEGALHRGSATGFEVIAPSGKIYTLTNAHVCGLQKDGFVLVQEKLHSGRSIPRRVLEVYAENDLCLVEGLEGYSGLSLANSADIGDLNYAIGYPLGEEMNLSNGYLKGIANVGIYMQEIPLDQCTGPYLKKEKVYTFFGPIEICTQVRKAMQTNIPIYPGNSGSPMVNAFGNVTGVVFASNSETKWGSSVPLEDVITFLGAY